jgi:hypothetical protein
LTLDVLWTAQDAELVYRLLDDFQGQERGVEKLFGVGPLGDSDHPGVGMRVTSRDLVAERCPLQAVRVGAQEAPCAQDLDARCFLDDLKVFGQAVLVLPERLGSAGQRVRLIDDPFLTAACLRDSCESPRD